jgi:hypothetical protein
MARVEKQPFLSASIVGSLVILGLASVLLDCGTPSQPNSIAGTWAGTVIDASGRQGTASLGLTDDRHDILQGTFSYAASDCSSNAKSVIGKISAGQISLMQTPPDPVPTSLQLTVDSSDQHLTGSYSDTSGNCRSSGTIDLTKP